MCEVIVCKIIVCEVIVCKVLYGKCKLLYVKFCMVSVGEAAGGGGGGGTRDTESKTRTPHKDVGKNTTPATFQFISGFALPFMIHNNQPLL